ncbi:MAG TPA: hypothetical protein VJJ24_01530 [Candidatus Paceibacterota bacterium]
MSNDIEREPEGGDLVEGSFGDTLEDGEEDAKEKTEEIRGDIETLRLMQKKYGSDDEVVRQKFEEAIAKLENEILELEEKAA